MKFTLPLILFIVCALDAGAQRFSANFNKEETINFINSKLQNFSKDKYDKVTFTGDKLVLTYKDSYSYEYKITDWADLKSISLDPRESGLDANLFLDFKKRSIEEKMADGLSKNKNTIIVRYLIFKEKNEDLEAAFIHLSRIAIESKFPGKPSIDETIAYINGYLSQLKRVEDYGRDGDMGNYYFYENIKAKLSQSEFSLNDFMLEVSFTHMREQQEFIVFFSEIVRIEPMYTKPEPPRAATHFIVFYEKRNDKKSDLTLPLFYGRTSDSENAITNSQIYKAFNHLRKLCGAPEPLKFD